MSDTIKSVNESTLSVFDEARLIIDNWEKESPQAKLVVMAMTDDEGMLASSAGQWVYPFELAGLFFAAAQLVCEKE